MNTIFRNSKCVTVLLPGKYPDLVCIQSSVTFRSVDLSSYLKNLISKAVYYLVYRIRLLYSVLRVN